MLIITQERWHSGAAREHVERILAAARIDRVEEGPPDLLLLPLGEVDWSALRREADLAEELGAVAREQDAWIAYAAPVIAADGQARSVGVVLAPDGAVALRTEKISPDFLDGFSDTACALGEKADLPVIDTPLGRVGLLVNEDALFHHYARLLVYKGCEILLNPSREKRDLLFDSRQRSRATRAYENSCYVAVATPRQIDRAGLLVTLPTASALYCYDDHHYEKADQEESFLIPDLDIVRLRRKRMSPFFNQPVYLRTALYAEGYRQMTEDRPQPKDLPKTRVEWVREAERRVEAQAEANRIDGPQAEQYGAILVQGEFRVIQKTTPDPQRIIQKNLDDAIELAARTAAAPSNRLVCFSEFFMTGSGGFGYRSPATLERIAITLPGNELDQLSDFAMKNKTYVAGSAFEKDPKFPGRVFNSAFILNDSGDLILRYRKLHCADIWGSLPDTTPGSIYSQYVEEYGYDALFPVVDTPIGKLACMVCFDHTVPETARMLTQRGAEVIIHTTSDNHGAGRRGWEECRETRAHENAAYILAPRPGGEYFDPEASHPGTFLRGYTRIVDFTGRVIGEADTSGKVGFNVAIDLAALRRHRAKSWANYPIWDDPRVYAHLYEQGWGMPNDLWAGDAYKNPYRGFKEMNAILERYYRDGVYLKPDAVLGGGSDSSKGQSKQDADYISA